MRLSGISRRHCSTLVINGQSIGRGMKIENISPITGERLGFLSEATIENAEQAVVAAKKGLKTKKDRRHILREAAQYIRTNLETIAREETIDCGKPINETRIDIEYSADIFEYFANQTMTNEELPGNYGFRAKRIVRPKGICLLITPWNYPLMQAALKVAPAIAAGNTCILKPSPLASLTCFRLAKDVDWQNTLQLLTGHTTAAQYLVKHRDINFVSFTGSEVGGRHVLTACAQAQPLRQAALELGGKSALIIRHDADLDLALELALQGILPAAGQICSATSRILVHANLISQFSQMLTTRLNQVELGIDPLSDECQFGPVISKDRLNAIESFVDQIQHTENLLFRSPPYNFSSHKGFWARPALFSDVSPQSALWSQEIFGPVLAMRTFYSDEEAITLANDSNYGLTGALVSRDTDGQATELLSQLNAGVLWLNTNQLLWPETPFGGMRSSGFGWEGGLAGLHEYTQYRTLIYPSSSSI